MEDLEELGTTVEEQAIVAELEAVERVADEAIGELAAVEDAVARTEERLREEERDADLTAFVERVEASVAAKAKPIAPPPTPSRAAAPTLAVGGLLSATGLFVLPAALLAGAFTLLAGIAVSAVGALLALRPRQK